MRLFHLALPMLAGCAHAAASDTGPAAWTPAYSMHTLDLADGETAVVEVGPRWQVVNCITRGGRLVCEDCTATFDSVDGLLCPENADPDRCEVGARGGGTWHVTWWVP